MSSSGYMMEPPNGQGRCDAGTMAVTQKGVGAALFTLATIIYALRMYTRVHLTNRALSMDDYLSGISVVCCWVFYGCTVGMIQYGGCAANFWQVTTAQYEILLKWTIPVNIFYMLSSYLAKISLLFFYLRLCPERNYRILVHTLVVCFVLYAVIYALISVFGCQPISASWDLAVQATGKCVDKFGFFLAASVANVVMDLVILLLPLRIVMPLQILRRQKISLLLLFATGSFVIVVAIYNCLPTVKLFSGANYTWGLAYELSWMYAELSGCVICAFASSLKPFFVRFIPALFRSRLGGDSDNSPGDITKGSSFCVRSRRQLSRKQTNAIELESGDDSESGRKVCDDDEARLWSDSGPRAQDTTGSTVLFSRSRISHEAHSKIRGCISSDRSAYSPPINTDITIIFTTKVLRDSVGREGHRKG
ncbi:hypothetical protein B0J13DRAFT_645576 [Dactylonectria estremocensis]|uniref:Rhodopsin domain-containing protein n=1 Tax=Dactylonectria estremocensis TaxID=1079267 RepID=A0A9P9E059_9HYPO|nr:hypothetical protein B0J13DRAFT_645576 [Dactylonectria estremocensis]